MTIMETIRVPGTIELSIESEILAQKGRYSLVERNDGRALKYAVLAKFGWDTLVTVSEGSDLPLIAQRYDGLVS